MKVLITGGAGFLGFHLAHFFASKGWEIGVLDIAQLDRTEYPENTQYIQGDVRDEDHVEKAMREVDVVIHAAAALPLESDEEILSTNIEGTEMILSVASKLKIPRVIYISSTAVYGVPIKHPIYETDPMVGVGPYGHSKIEAEHVCEKYRSQGMTVSIVRPKTFLGTHRLGVFEILFDWIHDGKKIPVIGTGGNHYQLLEVDDLCSAIYLCATEKDGEKVNTVFNVGASRYRTVKEDFETMFSEVGSKSRVFPTPAIPIKIALRIFEKLKLSPLYQWVYDTADKDSYVSTEKIQTVLGWKPVHSNSEALVKAYKWYQKNYREVKSRGSGTTHTVGWKQGILGIAKRFL